MNFLKGIGVLILMALVYALFFCLVVAFIYAFAGIFLWVYNVTHEWYCKKKGKVHREVTLEFF